MLYFLILLFVYALVLCFLRIEVFNPLDLILTTTLLIVVCRISNFIFSKIFKVPTNVESVFISALILALIITPSREIDHLLFAGLAGILAMASKYILVINKKHIFNPVAFGAVAAGVMLSQGASWWYGGIYLYPPLVLGGLLILRKVRRFKMAGIFLLITILFALLSDSITVVLSTLVLSPILFFVFIMFIEPLTSPYKMRDQVLYAALVAIAFYFYGNTLSLSYPLELALLSGNLFSFFMTGAFRQRLTLEKKTNLSAGVTSFEFKPEKKFNFAPGQYLEWTVPHKSPDSRGNRRFFTIASSPTEDLISLVSKFYENPSTFKRALSNLKKGDKIFAGNLAGEFTLPDKNEKLVFLAGGIGITPFISMVKYMLGNNSNFNTVLLYSNKTVSEIVYKDLFEIAKKVGLKTIYVNTDKNGYINEELIKKEVSDFKDRIFYISGPHSFVSAMEQMLQKIGVSKIKTDFFPGYA